MRVAKAMRKDIDSSSNILRDIYDGRCKRLADYKSALLLLRKDSHEKGHENYSESIDLLEQKILNLYGVLDMIENVVSENFKKERDLFRRVMDYEI